MFMSRAVAVACLTVLKWLLFVMGALLVILALKQYFVADAGGDVIRTSIASLASLAVGWICGRLSTRFERGS